MEVPQFGSQISWLVDNMVNITSSIEDLVIFHLPIETATLWTVTKLVVVSIILIVCYRVTSRPINRTKVLGDIGYLPYNGYTTKEMSHLVKKQRLNGIVPPVYPNGWFNILESRDLGQKESKSVSCLGLHLAVFRGEDGRAHIIDAYCPHLGANLAVGGQVKGNCLECPFHGWRFNGDSGKCTHIPYSDKVPGQAAVKSYICVYSAWTSFVKSYICLERNQFICMWYDAEGREPDWEPDVVREVESGEMVYRGRTEHIVNTHIEEIPLNGADVFHLQQVHSAFITEGTDLRKTNPDKKRIIKHDWWGNWEPGSETEKHFGYLSLRQCIKLFGWTVPMSNFRVTAKQMGPGLVNITFHDFLIDMCFIHSVTPVEPMVQRLIHQIYIKWYIPPVVGSLILWGDAMQVERDVMIWNNKRYNKNPVFAKSMEDSLLARHRRWYCQFYSEHSPRLVGGEGDTQLVMAEGLEKKEE